MEGPSASNCRRNEVNPAISVKGQHRIKTESLLLKSHCDNLFFSGEFTKLFVTLSSVPVLRQKETE